MRVEYNTSNSGGNWWLTLEDWKALEAAGWVVEWFKEPWLGAMARSATRFGLGLMEAVWEWERVTGACSTDAGCPCCGQPHRFTEYDDDGKQVASGPNASYSASW